MRAEYLVGETTANIRRNALVTTGAMLAVFVSLLLGYLALISREAVTNSTVKWQEGVTVIAWLRDDLSVVDHTQLQQEILGWEEVENVLYVSKADALDEFKRLFPDEDRVYDVLDSSTLPASLRLVLIDAENHEAVTNRLGRVAGVREIDVASEEIENLRDLSRLLNWGMLALAIFLGVAAVVLIANTVRLGIYARREEISIMKLVGASNWYVRTPFLVEGLIEGLVGAALAVSVGWALYQGLFRDLGETIPIFESEVQDSFLLGRAILILLFGAFAGVVGSGLGLVRYLRE